MSPSLRPLQLPLDIPPQPEKPGRVRQVQLAGGILAYRLVRARRRTIGLFVDAEGVEVRAPRDATVGDIEAFIRKNELWVRERLAGPRRVSSGWQARGRLPC